MTKGAVKPVAKSFKGNLRAEMIVTKADVKAAMDSGGVPLVDHRPNDQYIGINKHGKAARNGTIPAIVYAEGEHSRRAATELLVLLGDIGKLKDEDSPDKLQRGLRDRIAGSLSALPLLLRLADQEKGRSRAAPNFSRLRLLLAENELSALAGEISGLSVVYPFQGIDILPARASLPRVRNALQLHKTLCLACHDFPYLDTQRPAFNLYDQAKKLPEREFAARMLAGVRGDTTTGLGNPFTDEEIAALIVLYRSTESTEEALRLKFIAGPVFSVDLR